MCKLLEVSSSGYYKWTRKVPSKRELRNKLLAQKIRSVYFQSKRRYGSPRVAMELNMTGTKVSKPLVAKLMRQQDLRSIVRKKYRVTTNSSHTCAIVQNELGRAFDVKEQNKVWVSDITYVHTEQGWLYLTSVIDLFDRKVIGWALSETMKTIDTTVPAFDMAIKNRPIERSEELIFHSDRGIQYACDEFKNTIEKHKSINRSMSRKGNCWDNAVAESFFKTLKTELIYHHKYKTKNEAALSIFEYIETWYNKKRRHKYLNNMTILEHENLFNNNCKNVA